jgi:hypothetical protein
MGIAPPKKKKLIIKYTYGKDKILKILIKFTNYENMRNKNLKPVSPLFEQFK